MPGLVGTGASRCLAATVVAQLGIPGLTFGDRVLRWVVIPMLAVVVLSAVVDGVAPLVGRTPPVGARRRRWLLFAAGTVAVVTVLVWPPNWTLTPALLALFTAVTAHNLVT